MQEEKLKSDSSNRQKGRGSVQRDWSKKKKNRADERKQEMKAGGGKDVGAEQVKKYF